MIGHTPITRFSEEDEIKMKFQILNKTNLASILSIVLDSCQVNFSEKSKHSMMKLG